MGTLKRSVINCPQTADHPHKRILLLLGHKELDVYCKEHKWLRLELFQGGESIDFSNVAVKITEIEPNTYFDLEPVPVMAIGEFKNKRGKVCKQL